MKAITLRNVPPAVEKAILAKARRKRISVNRAVIELLEERVGMRDRRVIHHDLDRFIGSWTAKEAKEFDDVLREMRQIDPELWK
jgi:DNA polymerase III delta subunit